MEKEIIQDVSAKLENGLYREAVETIVMHMRSLADEAGEKEFERDLEEVESILFDIPNIDWKKVEEGQGWLVRK